MSSLGRCPDLRNPDLGGSTVVTFNTGEITTIITNNAACMIKALVTRFEVGNVTDSDSDKISIQTGKLVETRLVSTYRNYLYK